MPGPQHNVHFKKLTILVVNYTSRRLKKSNDTIQKVKKEGRKEGRRRGGREEGREGERETSP